VDLASASHNLVTIDSRLRYTFAAGSISPTVVHAPIATAEPDANSMNQIVTLVTHWTDRVAGAVRHTRRIALAHSGAPTLEVVDSLSLEQPASVVLRWHFAPAWSVMRVAGAGLRATMANRPHHVQATIQCDEPSLPTDVVLAEYRHSGMYGSIQRATAVAVSVKPAITACIRSTFWVNRVAQ
jgi:hypothetical protein